MSSKISLLGKKLARETKDTQPAIVLKLLLSRISIGWGKYGLAGWLSETGTCFILIDCSDGTKLSVGGLALEIRLG